MPAKRQTCAGCLQSVGTYRTIFLLPTNRRFHFCLKRSCLDKSRQLQKVWSEMTGRSIITREPQ